MSLPHQHGWDSLTAFLRKVGLTALALVIFLGPILLLGWQLATGVPMYATESVTVTRRSGWLFTLPAAVLWYLILGIVAWGATGGFPRP
jgi:hypothetical protein